MSVEINKRFIATWTVIGSIVIGIMGFVGAQYFETAKDYMDKVNHTQTELGLLKQKIVDDDSQWQTLQRQDETLQTQEVEIRVMKLVVQKMLEDYSGRNITIRIEGDGFALREPPRELLRESLRESPRELSKESLKEPKKEVKPEELEEIFKELEDNAKRVEEKGDYHDYRRDQMIQQRSFNNTKK